MTTTISKPYHCPRTQREVIINGTRAELYNGRMLKAAEEVYSGCSGEPACGVKFRTSACPFSARTNR